MEVYMRFAKILISHKILKIVKRILLNGFEVATALQTEFYFMTASTYSDKSVILLYLQLRTFVSSLNFTKIINNILSLSSLKICTIDITENKLLCKFCITEMNCHSNDIHKVL